MLIFIEFLSGYGEQSKKNLLKEEILLLFLLLFDPPCSCYVQLLTLAELQPTLRVLQSLISSMLLLYSGQEAAGYLRMKKRIQATFKHFNLVSVIYS